MVPKEYGDANGFQAGSTFKLFVLASAINQGIPLSTTINSPQELHIDDEEFENCDGPYAGDGEGWDVSNSTGSGTFDLYSGTQQSVNTFFAQLETQTGMCEPLQLAEDMGVKVPLARRCRRGSSASPTATPSSWPRPTPPSRPAASTATPAR